jgi:hypothetical protein
LLIDRKRADYLKYETTVYLKLSVEPLVFALVDKTVPLFSGTRTKASPDVEFLMIFAFPSAIDALRVWFASSL